ncbi:TetR/AcrR family transcriptional regulator [Nonomuraea sp. NPDC050786]|uniref:TetR/AcrR family transcriptional regulator n=1 Tax=Nonomuraea sp. NPDC050786 TaxID=3154840 RepID=UPI00340D0484
MSQIPPVMARMWGREPAPRRGPRPRLDLGTITAAAIAIADAEGLAGVSMSSVAVRVGVAPMTLYRYVGSKEELLTVMCDGALPAPPELGDLAWRAYLAAWTRANRDFLLGRPWLLSLPYLTPPMGPRRLSWLERVLDALAGTSLGTGEKFNVATTLSGYALTSATTIAGMLEPEPGDPVVHPSDYGAMLVEVVEPHAYPALSAALRSGLPGEADGWTEDGDFRFGLDLLLDGVEALIARRGSQPGGGR